MNLNLNRNRNWLLALLTVLLCLLFPGAFAQTVVSLSPHSNKVVDYAKLLGGDAETLNRSLASGNVWFETFATAPGGDLKAYADKRIADLAGKDRAFLIVVTTEPRKWRISMSPVGFVSPAATQKIGEELGAGLRRGDVKAAVTTAAEQLEALRTKAQAKPAASSSDEWWLISIAIGVVFLACVFGFAIVYDRKRKRREREEAAWRAERQRYSVQMAKTAAENASRKCPTPSDREVRRVWDRYSADERRDIIQRYQYHPRSEAASHNPLDFWFLLWATNSLSASTSSSAHVHSVAPASGLGLVGASNDDEDRRRSSRSDTVASSSGFDSGSSSSSSDSSGSSGDY
jgi:hypothetical protein